MIKIKVRLILYVRARVLFPSCVCSHNRCININRMAFLRYPLTFIESPFKEGYGESLPICVNKKNYKKVFSLCKK